MNLESRLAFLLTLVCCQGCNSAGSGFFPVQGTVTYRAQPVAGATVAFRGDGSQTPAIGITNERGEFSLRTGADDGAKPGEHIVTVTKYVADTETNTEDVSMEAAGRGPVSTASYAAIPLKYAAASSSNLRFTVTTDGVNQCTLELAD